MPDDPQFRRDRDHIKTLAIFHYVMGGLAFLGIAFLGLHYFVMDTLFANPELWEDSEGGPPPEEFWALFK